MDNNNKEVLLSVQHLEQFFKMGKEQLKAVNDVSFDIYKGEVFGLVGESGCGKTTTGRSIIRLYDITGGSVYFKGQRIAAGTRSYRQAIEDEKKALKEDLAKLTTDAEKQARKQQSEKLINEMKQEIASAKMIIRTAIRSIQKRWSKRSRQSMKNYLLNLMRIKMSY